MPCTHQHDAQGERRHVDCNPPCWTPWARTLTHVGTTYRGTSLVARRTRFLQTRSRARPDPTRFDSRTFCPPSTPSARADTLHHERCLRNTPHQKFRYVIRDVMTATLCGLATATDSTLDTEELGHSCFTWMPRDFRWCSWVKPSRLHTARSGHTGRALQEGHKRTSSQHRGIGLPFVLGLKSRFSSPKDEAAPQLLPQIGRRRSASRHSEPASTPLTARRLSRRSRSQSRAGL